MDGDEYLRSLAAEIVAAGDVNWWAKFSEAFRVLDQVGAVDLAAAVEIGEGIREGLAARTGQQVPRFLLASARSGVGHQSPGGRTPRAAADAGAGGDGS